MANVPKPTIELADLIKTVRIELQKAEDGGDKQVRFRVDEVELEVSVAIQHNEAIKGGFKLCVFEAGADSSDEASHGHRITIRLKPQGRDGADVLISGEGIEPRRTTDEVLMGG